MGLKLIKAAITGMLVIMYLSALMSLTGCVPPPRTADSTAPSTNEYNDHRIVKIRNCEYIEQALLNTSGHWNYSYVHCGDCSNPIHQQDTTAYGEERPTPSMQAGKW